MKRKKDVTPPGMEETVSALEKSPTVENPYAVAWALYGKEGDAVTTSEGLIVLPSPEHLDIIKQRGGSWVLLSKKTGKVLGVHETEAEAKQQEAAIQARKHADSRRTVRRFDVGELAPAEYLANGWLRVEGKSARTGILIYEDPDGKTHRELVLPDELFAEQSLASARMVPVTNQHPAQLLDAETALEHQVGSVGENLRAEGQYLVAPLMVTDAETVKAVRDGRQELSWGYECELDPADPALFAEWGDHDAIQRQRRYNHLAIVDHARAGEGARLRLDSRGNQVAFNANPAPVLASRAQSTTEKPPMAQIKIDGVAFELSESNAGAIQNALDRAAKRASIVKSNAKTIIAQRDGFKAVLDAMKARMVGCDECGGMGKHDDGTKCDYCDGEGHIRMHDAIKSMEPAEIVSERHMVESDDDDDKKHMMGDDDDDALAKHLAGDDDDDDDDDDLMDETELEVEQETEEEAGKIAKAGQVVKKDAAARKVRRDGVRKARKARRDSMERRVARAAAARASLVIEASKHLGSEAKLDAMSSHEIKAAVIKKLAPHVKLDKMSGAAVEILFASEIARVAASQPAPMAPIDAARLPISAGAHHDSLDLSGARHNYASAMRDAWKTSK